MKDVTFEECKYSSDIVPYMYGELSATEGSTFESHLIDCAQCTDEFASISHARYEIYDWKKLEFDRLETPHVEIPYEVTTGESTFAWIEKLRAAFSHRWSVPGFAFAGLAVVFIFAAVFLMSSDNGREIASGVDNDNTPSMADRSGSTSVVATPSAGNESSNETAHEPDPEPIRTVAPSHRGEKRSVRSVKPTRPRRVEARQALTRVGPKSVPTLNEFSNDEDTSLRLAELFDDVETMD